MKIGVIYNRESLHRSNRRWMRHKLDAKVPEYNQSRFYRAINKYGIENFEFAILMRNIPHNCLDCLETIYINLFNSFKDGYNSTRGGSSDKDRIVTEVTRAKLKEFRHTQESKEKIGNANRGKIYGPKFFSEDIRKKISKSLLGKKKAFKSRPARSEESKKLQSEKMKALFKEKPEIFANKYDVSVEGKKYWARQRELGLLKPKKIPKSQGSRKGVPRSEEDKIKMKAGIAKRKELGLKTNRTPEGEANRKAAVSRYQYLKRNVRELFAFCGVQEEKTEKTRIDEEKAKRAFDEFFNKSESL